MSGTEKRKRTTHTTKKETIMVRTHTEVQPVYMRYKELEVKGIQIN